MESQKGRKKRMWEKERGKNRLKEIRQKRKMEMKKGKGKGTKKQREKTNINKTEKKEK